MLNEIYKKGFIFEKESLIRYIVVLTQEINMYVVWIIKTNGEYEEKYLLNYFENQNYAIEYAVSFKDKNKEELESIIECHSL